MRPLGEGVVWVAVREGDVTAEAEVCVLRAVTQDGGERLKARKCKEALEGTRSC